MFPVNGKFFIECDVYPDKPVFIVNQGSTWKTFPQYGDAEANAKRRDLELNTVTILEIKPVLVLKEKTT